MYNATKKIKCKNLYSKNTFNIMYDLNLQVSDHGNKNIMYHGNPVFSTDKTDCHDITEILLEVALNTISQPKQYISVV
jgi:hypothetical protein